MDHTSTLSLKSSKLCFDNHQQATKKVSILQDVDVAFHDLKNQLCTSTNTLKKSKSLISVLRSEKKDLKNQVLKLSSTASSLSLQLASNKNDSIKIANHLNHTTSNLNQLHNDKDRLIIDLKEVTNKLTKVTRNLAHEVENSSRHQSSLSKLQAEFDELKVENDSNLALLQVANSKSVPAQEEAQSMMVANRELSGNIAAVESELRVLKNDISSLRQELIVKNETNAVLSAQLEAIQNKGTVVSHKDMDRYRLLEGDLLKVQMRYSDLERSLDAHNEMLAEEGRQKNEIRNELSLCLQQKDANLKQIEALDVEVAAHKKWKQGEIAKSTLNPMSSNKTNANTKKIIAMNISQNMMKLKVGQKDTLEDVNRLKKKLAEMISKEYDTNDKIELQQKINNQLKVTIDAMGTKLNFMSLEINENKSRLTRNKVDKEILLQQLKSQREQNLTLHQRLGELFGNSTHDWTISDFNENNVVDRDAYVDETARTALERSVFNWNLNNSLKTIKGCSGIECTPKFEAIFVTEKDFHRQSNLLNATRTEPRWDVVPKRAPNGVVRNKARADEFMQRFQMKQFLHVAQNTKDKDKMWSLFAEKVAFVVSVAIEIEMSAGRTSGQVRLACADLSGKLEVLRQELKTCAERLEQERICKHKTILKYVQEALKDCLVDQKDSKGERNGGNNSLDSNNNNNNNNSKTTIALRLADSCLDDETVHGLAALLLAKDPSCNDDANGFNASVDTLLLRDNFLTDISATSLAELISQSKSLRMVDLRGNAFTDEGIEIFKGCALRNKTIDRVEQPNGGFVLVCHRDIDNSIDIHPMIIDFRNCDVTKIDKTTTLNPEAVDLLLGKISTRVNLNSKWAKMATETKTKKMNMSSSTRVPNTNSKVLMVKTTGGIRLKKTKKKRGIKETGGFGNDFVDYALTAPPKHMPLVENSKTFLTETQPKNTPNRWASTANRSRRPSFDVTQLVNDENDSLQASAAAASDAPPGEKELGNLLDKKIRLMQRNVARTRTTPKRNTAGVTGGTRSTTGGGIRGVLRPKSASYLNCSANRRGSMAAFETAGKIDPNKIYSNTHNAKIRKPPSNRLRPKSAVLKRLPY